MARRAGTNTKKTKGKGFKLSDLLDIVSSGKDAWDSMEAQVRLRVHVGSGCERALVIAAKEALVAERPGGIVEVMGLEAPAASMADPDAVIVLAAGGETGAGPLVRYYLACEVPCALVADSALDAPDFGEAADGLFGVVAASTPEALPAKLGEWLAAHVDNQVALAANFPCCRDAVVDSLAKACAVENALVGVVSLIPGSDFPLMTAAQAKLALDIAASYGCGVDVSRAAEIAGVVGLGLVYRGVARSAVGLVPGFGWALKGAMGYAGTVATAKAVQARFEGAGALTHGKKSGPARTEAPAEPEVIRLPPAAAPVAADVSASGDGYLVIGGEGERS